MVKITSSVSILFLLMYLVFIFILHIKQNKLSIITNAVSDYGATEDKKIFSFAGICTIIANISLALAFYSLPVDFSKRSLAIITLLGRALLVIGIIYFPTDIGNELKSKSSKIHLLFAIAQFTLIAIFVFNIRTPLYSYRPHGFNDIMHVLEYLVTIGLTGLSACLIIKNLKKYFGIFERIFLFSSALFLIFTALVLFGI